MSQQLFKKPKDVRYTDMCIWIDNNFYKPDCDYNQAYTYMWLLAYMLACKARYFNTKRDYEEYSSLLAYSTYQRMIDPDKTRIKSVLNYMKSIMYFRKGLYESQRHQEVINPEYDEAWDPAKYVDNCRSALEKSNHDRVEMCVCDIISELPCQIKKYIPKVYRSDKEVYNNIYKSCLLSLINKFTLPNISNDYLMSHLEDSPNFDEVKYYRKHLDEHIILWHLPESLEAVVMVIINKVSRWLINEIKDVVDSFKLSEEDYSAITSSAFIVGGDNETGR